MEVVGVEVVLATCDDVLHDGCGEQTEGDLVACREVGRVVAEVVPKRSYENVSYSRYNKVVGKGVVVVGMGEGMVGVGVGEEDSMLGDKEVRMKLNT